MHPDMRPWLWMRMLHNCRKSSLTMQGRPLEGDVKEPLLHDVMDGTSPSYTPQRLKCIPEIQSD